MSKKIRLAGTGVMGRAVIEKMIAAGQGITAYDPFPEALEKAAGLGAEVVDCPAELVRGAEMVIILLPGPAQIEKLVRGPEGLLARAEGAPILVDMSTSDPALSEELAAQAVTQGIGWLDAPILGRPDTVGNWCLPVGGRAEDLEFCRPVLEIIAGRIMHIGPAGSGHKLKLLNQMMFGAINAMTAEMMAISEKVGIPPKTLYEAISASRAGTVSNLFLELGRRIADDDYANPTFTVDLLIKDVSLGVAMARRHKAPPVLGRSVECLNELSQVQGHGGQDTSVMWKSVRKLWE